MAGKFIPFEDVEQLATIEQLANMLGLVTYRHGPTQIRSACPVHGGEKDTLAISPQVKSKRGSVGVFFCQAAKSGGDRIGLVAHCMELGQQDAAFFIAEQFGVENSTVDSTSTGTVNSTVSKSRATVPQKPEARTQPAPAFDPDKFFAKLQFEHEQVQAAGYAAEDAERIGVGYHPQYKVLFVGHRNADGTWSGFSKLKDGKLTPPPRWIASTVVPFQKRA